MSRNEDWKTKQLTELIKDQILYKASSWDMEELVGALPEKNEEACDKFCERYELGNWFYEALTLNEINITELLVDLGNEREVEEKEAECDRADIDRDLRRSQGWPG